MRIVIDFSMVLDILELSLASRCLTHHSIPLDFIVNIIGRPGDYSIRSYIHKCPVIFLRKANGCSFLDEATTRGSIHQLEIGWLLGSHVVVLVVMSGMHRWYDQRRSIRCSPHPANVFLAPNRPTKSFSLVIVVIIRLQDFLLNLDC